jgi:hypothetical protein
VLAESNGIIWVSTDIPQLWAFRMIDAIALVNIGFNIRHAIIISHI